MHAMDAVWEPWTPAALLLLHATCQTSPAAAPAAATCTPPPPSALYLHYYLHCICLQSHISTCATATSTCTSAPLHALAIVQGEFPSSGE
jgi:hypothetical protein